MSPRCCAVTETSSRSCTFSLIERCFSSLTASSNVSETYVIRLRLESGNEVSSEKYAAAFGEQTRSSSINRSRSFIFPFLSGDCVRKIISQRPHTSLSERNTKRPSSSVFTEPLLLNSGEYSHTETSTPGSGREPDKRYRSTCPFTKIPSST